MSIEHYREEFDRTWPWLEKAMEHYGKTHSKEQLWAEIYAGKAQLWPMENAVNLTRVDTHPTGLREAFAWLAGGKLEDIAAWEPHMCEWAKGLGCHRAAIVGRRGWLRALPGYRELVTTFAKDL